MLLEGIGRFNEAQHGFCIVPVCRGKLQDRNFYAFVAVEPQNYRYFKENYTQGKASSFDVFGRELLRGWGSNPPEDIIDHISGKYDIEFGVENSFVERLIALTKDTAENTTGKFPFPLKPAIAS